MPTITDPFFRQLYSKLAEELENRKVMIASGGSLTLGEGAGVDIAATAMKYKGDVSYIEALQFVIELGFDIDREIYGTRKAQVDGDD